MVFLGAVVLPHGAMSFDGEGDSSLSKASRERFENLPERLRDDLSGLFNSCVKAAKSIAKLKPDVVVLHTPHGISLSKSVAVYLNKVAKGTALWNDEWSEFEVELPMERNMAELFLEKLQEAKIDAEGVNCFSVTEAPLRWGEVVPTWYLQEAFKKSGIQPKYVILSQSLKKIVPHVNEERMAIGKCLGQVINSVSERVVVAISGDLSHTHPPTYSEIPLYLPDPRWSLGLSDKAKIFDRAIEGWVLSSGVKFLNSNDPLSSSSNREVVWDANEASKWLVYAAGVHNEARSCGIGGFFVLHGVLLESKIVHGQCFGRFAPTYYGMMSALFLPS